MSNHLGNPNVELIKRTAIADLALSLAEAMIEEHIACIDNRAGGTSPGEDDALIANAEAAINRRFDLHKTLWLAAKGVAEEIVKA